MTRKSYIILDDSIIELKESGITSGPIIRKIIDKFVEILNRRLKERFANYKEDKFLTKIYGKQK